MQQPTLYEFPLNERMRNFMRLENQFAYLDYLAHLSSFWDSQASVIALIEILNILERNDIRGDVIKELEKNILNFRNLLNVPGINIQRLQNTLDELNDGLLAVQATPVKESSTLREDDLLNTIRQRISVTSSVNSFDLPSFYYWLQQNHELRQHQLLKWLRELRPIQKGIILLNNLLRDSADFIPETAVAGFFQRALNSQHGTQMVRILLPADAACFPETSGGKHRVSIRFLGYEESAKRPTQMCGDLEFHLSCA